MINANLRESIKSLVFSPPSRFGQQGSCDQTAVLQELETHEIFEKLLIYISKDKSM
jgi:hypothetical protein